MAQVGHGSVAIVGDGFNHHGHPMRGIAFIDHLFIYHTVFGFTRAGHVGRRRDRCRAGDQSGGGDERADRRRDDNPQTGAKVLDHMVNVPSGDWGPVRCRRDEVAAVVDESPRLRVGTMTSVVSSKVGRFATSPPWAVRLVPSAAGTAQAATIAVSAAAGASASPASPVEGRGRRRRNRRVSAASTRRAVRKIQRATAASSQ